MFLKNIIRRIINKEAYILKRCVKKGLKKVMLDLVKDIKKNINLNFTNV